MKNALCLLMRHRWRVEDIGGESYEVCARCGHYRNDVDWRDFKAERPHERPVGGGADMSGGSLGGMDF